MFDYRDPYYVGKLDGVLKEFETPLYLYRITGKTMGPDGTVRETKKKYLIYGSLQAWSKRRNYNEDGTQSSSRIGKLFVDYRYKLIENDIIQKNNNFFRVLDPNDYDYAEVHDFAIERIGYDEIVRYKFDEYLEERFPEVEENKE